MPHRLRENIWLKNVKSYAILLCEYNEKSTFNLNARMGEVLDVKTPAQSPRHTCTSKLERSVRVLSAH